ncbi:hypothetical protein SARC_06091 [Sphaeroforma arctica JP610]|uniref:Translocon-associated protein subunit beta n=1 Tax=Sphaeroforma arctica JP610 TaxID=667725 RepID=A0A0L0FXP0_9EUKA|nr:hypothetical protein SARC_06091 [Sphaeroforma arctica JP610]KNC81590.1 hypothetical protein SARC_06091 [Sphaeroforma arctica JP610]|eukprot:XP_014155492.1 hypothetical protein SARC_06091 [Sphaeroforma arctica JP610]
MSFIMQTVLLALGVFACMVSGQGLDSRLEKGGARVLAMKTIGNRMAVEDKDLTVLYNFYNVGDGIATDIRVESPDTFIDWPLKNGLSTGFQIPFIQPGENVTHALIYQLGKVGKTNTLNATDFTYKNGKKLVLSKTSAPGPVKVQSNAEYERLYTLQMRPWLLYGACSALIVVLPYLGFQSSSSKAKRA